VIEASGYVDGDWYRSQYPAATADPADSPVLEYLTEGYRHGRNPGPLFDGNRYLAENPDVRQAGVNPLLHFLGSPTSEGRRAWTVDVPAPAGRQNVTVELHPRFDGPVSLAVMVHAYYPETVDAICASLANIGMPFTLLVSVPSESGREAVAAAVRRHRLPVELDIRITPNRGRNFAPLLAEFGERVAGHDYLLHLHTKKSLYAGEVQQGWRDELVQSLVGSPATVMSTLQLLITRPEVGLVYPTTTDSLSYWAHHWLGNRHHVDALFARLDVRTYPTDGYFPYPVGGMFWARVEAIRPLLTAGFGFDEFPAEEGQIDGTLAHAIERCFVPLVHSRDYRFVEVESGTGAFQLDWSGLHLDQYLALSADGLRKAIAGADLVSFDIFDTVITRLSVHPDAVMRSVGERLRSQFPQVTDFFSRRKDAEVAARQAKEWKGDVSLTDIYRQFPVGGPWTDEVVQAAQLLEVDSELAATVPRAAVAEAVAWAAGEGRRVIAVSDTYLERSHIERLLKAAGVLDHFDQIYLSSECGRRKDRGDMWDYLVDTEKVAPGRWLHVGDNEHSDLQAATDRSIPTYHCMNPSVLIGLRGLSRLTTPDPLHWGNDLLMGPTVARIANDPFPDTGHYTPIDLPRPADVGYAVFGPMVMAFLIWIAQRPEIGDVDHLYFLSREGYLLQAAWERMRAAQVGDLPASTYLLTSRRSAMAAAQGVRFEPEDVLEGSDFDGTVGAWLASRLGFALPADSPHADRRIRLPDDEAAGRAILDGLRADVIDHGSAELATVTRYLEESGLRGARGPGIVDIGYSATIQKHLQTVLGRGLTGFYMGTLAKAGQVETSGGSAVGCFVDGHPVWSTPSPFLLTSLVLEAFLTAPQGQTDRTEIHQGRVVHTFRAEHRTVRELDILRELHAGALSYCDDLLGAFGVSLLAAPFDPDVALSMVTALASGVIRSPRVATAMVVDDDFCGVPRRTAPIA
jgi:FMN phosphatase YigB (HAD superfamily)